MARWALLLTFGSLLFANTAWLEEASDIEASGDDVDYVDGDVENVSNGSSIEPMNWDGRRATPKIPPRQRIWKAIRREVRDMKNFLPTLANNISFMELDVRDMNRNFFSIAGDVRFIKNEVMYIKRQGHIIWENVTDTRRDHKRMNKTLWWILGNVTQVIEDVDRTSMAITSIETSYGSLAVELEKAVSQITDAQTLSSDFQNMRLEVNQLKTSMEYGSAKMTEEIDIIRDMVSHLSHDIVGIRQIFADGFSHVDHHVNSAKSRILANVSAIDAKVRSHGGLLNSITDNVANIGSNLAGFSGRINDVWDLTRHIGGHMDQFDTRILKVGDQMTGVHDNVGQVNALISNVGYKVQDVGRQLSDMEHHMGAVGTQFIGFLGSVNDNFVKVNVHLEDVHNKIISNVSRVRGDLDEMKEQLRDIRQVIAEKCEGACPNGQPSTGNGNGAAPPHMIDAEVTVTTAKPGLQPPEFPSNGIPPPIPINGYPSNGVDVQNGDDFQTDPGHRPNGHPPMYPPTYPSTTMPPYPYPPSSTSPYPPVHIPTSTLIPTPMPVYPHPAVPTSPYPPAHLPTSTYAPIPVPGYPPEHPSPAVPQLPNGYPSEYPANGKPPVPPFLPTTASPLPPGYPNGYPTEYPSNGYPPAHPFVPTTATPLPPGYPNGYPTEYPSNGHPPVPPFLPTTAMPLPPGYPNGYPTEYPSNGHLPVPPFLPTTAMPLPPGYPNGYPTEYPSNGHPPVPPFLPTTAMPLPPGYPNGYPTEYPPNGHPPPPPFLPTTAAPLPPGYPNGYPSEYPPNGHPPPPPFLPTIAAPLPPGYPNGYPSEYPPNGQPPVPPYLPTTGSPPPPLYPPQPVPSDHPRPSVPQVHPPVHPRPTIPVIYPHLPETQIPVSPSHPEVPSGHGESLPIGVSQDPRSRGLPIGCGDEFTGYCACLCPCDCTCPVFNPTQSSIKRTKYERFPYMRKKCQCLCSCPCRSSAIFDSRPMTPALQPSPDEAHVPMFQPPPHPDIPSTTHSPLIPNGQPPTPVVTSRKPPSTETTSEFDRPGGVSTTEEPDEETDGEEKPLDCCSQLREYFADEISWVLEAFGYELEEKMRKLREELYSFFDGVVRFHVDVSDLATDLKTQMSIAAANIVGILNSVASRVYSLPIHNGPVEDQWFGFEARDNQPPSILPPARPAAHRPPMSPPEFTPPGQTPTHLPNMPNARPHGRPQLSNPQLSPNRPTPRPQFPPGRPTERPNVNMHETRPSQRPQGRPLGGSPGRPLGGQPARPLGGPPGRPLGVPPARPQGGSSQGGSARPLGGSSNRPQGGSSTRPHGRPNSQGRPSGRPQHQGQSSSQSSARPSRPPSEPAQNSPAILPSKPNTPWSQSRKFDNKTITTTEVSQYSSNARRYFPFDHTGERRTTIANTSSAKSKNKNKRNKGCAIRRKKIGARSDSDRLTEVGDKELALANVDTENDYENYDDPGNEGDSYDVDVESNGPIELPGTELAIPDEDLPMVGTPIDQLTFHKMLQEHINEQMMKAVQPGPGHRPKGNRFPLSPWRGRPRNRYKLRPRPSFPMVPGFPLIPPPMGLRPPIPPIGIAMPRIPIPNPLAIRPPPMPDIFGSLPPGAMVAGINGSPYSVSYTDGRGNSWNVNVNRRNYPVTSDNSDVTEADDEGKASDEELEPQDEDAQQEIEDEVQQVPEQDGDSDGDETNETTEHAETNEEAP